MRCLEVVRDTEQWNGIAAQTDIVELHQHVSVQQKMRLWRPLQASAEIGGRIREVRRRCAGDELRNSTRARRSWQIGWAHSE